jgi:hypothetical protein
MGAFGTEIDLEMEAGKVQEGERMREAKVILH